MLDHYLTYQHSVQKFFIEHRGCYDGVVVPLSIISAYPGGTNGFIRALCAKDRNKRYGIDPRTPLFQRAWDRKKHVRSTHQRIAEILGPPFSNLGLTRPLIPQDFTDDLVDSCTRRCLQFQLDFRHTDDERKLKKYAKLLKLDAIGELCEPQFLIPPYFAFESYQDPWFEVATRVLRLAGNYSDGVPIWPVWHFHNPSALQPIETLAEILRQEQCEGVWLFPNDFREHKASRENLQALLDVVEQLADSGVASRMLHGGYFSLVASKFGLKGFANGVGYGEWKDSGYHRGGAADIRLYCLPLHKFVGPAHAEILIEEDPEHFATDNSLFERVYQERISFAEVTSREANTHFMLCRQQEVDFVASHDIAEISQALQETADILNRSEEEQIASMAESLETWASVLVH